MAAFAGSAAMERVETKLRFTLFEEGPQLCQHPLPVQAHFFTDLPAGKLLLVNGAGAMPALSLVSLPVLDTEMF